MEAPKIFTKALNRYSGKDFEKHIYCFLTGEKLELSGIHFSDDMQQDAKLVADKIKETLNPSNVIYAGDNYKQDGDLIIDNLPVEIKYVSSGGSGTYYNTSMSVFEKFGMRSFRDFDTPIRNFLESFFGKSVYENNSPVSMKESKLFRQDENNYKLLKSIDKECRKQYVNYIYNFFKANKNVMVDFYHKMLSKELSSKNAPEYIFVFSRTSKATKVIRKSELVKNDFILSKSDLSFTISNLRFAVSWQNGSGLNNPTIRVFLNGSC